MMDFERLNPYQRAMMRVERNMNSDVNCIPSPFDLNFNMFWPGIERETYTIVTGSSGVGKTQITDFMYLHTPVKYYFDNHKKLDFRLRIKYYTLEMSSELKALQCLSHHVFHNTGHRLGVKGMLSTKEKLSPGDYEIMKHYSSYFDEFYNIVEFHEGYIPPYAIYSDLREYYEQSGTIHKEEYTKQVKDDKTGKMVDITGERFHHYEPNDPNEYVIVIVDHASLVAQQRGLNKRETMEKLSSYMMTIRNQFGATIVTVNQQASDQEGKENYRRPTLSGLGDNKAVQRDADYILGIYDPFRHKEAVYRGWKIAGHENSLHKRYRELTILKNRFGSANESVDLLYDGTTESFWEMPEYVKGPSRGVNDPGIQTWYDMAASLPIVM